MRVAVFGGSFDPPHLGHQQAVRLLLSMPDIDRVLVVPVYEHAFAKSLAGFEHRVRMCELCMLDAGQVEVSRIEAGLGRPSYTLNTLQAIHAKMPQARLRLVVGADVLQEAERWHKFEAVRQLAPLLPLGRRGFSSHDAPAPVLPEVSSTDIRNLLHDRPSGPIEPALRSRLLRLIPAKVLEYIATHDLYR